MAKAKVGPRSTAQKGGKSRLYVALALAVPVAIVMLPSAIVLGAAMVPTMVAWLVDPSGRRYLAVTVGALNFAGSLYFLNALWMDVHDVSHAFAVLRNVYGWLIAYGAAAAGYGVHYLMPGLTESIVRFRVDARMKRLDKRMRDIADEWGDAVGGAQGD